MCNCYICKEPILDFEKTIEETVDGKKYIIHNRPGCKHIWLDIKHSPGNCEICGKETNNLDLINDNYYIVCEGKCTDKIKNNKKVIR